MANETPKNQLTDLQKKLAATDLTDKILRVVATDMWAVINQRVFARGLLTSGGSPSPYSTKPLYAPVLISSKLSPLGKNGKSKFKNGNTKKSRYIPDGYSGLKSKIGRPNRFDFTGQLKKAYTFSKESASSYVHGFIGNARLTATKKSTTTTHGDIVEGLEEKYGEIFGLTEQENKRVDEIVSRELDVYLAGI